MGARRPPARALVSKLRWAGGLALCAAMLSCGGGGNGYTPGGTTPVGSNVASVIIDAGPSNNTVNTLYTTVTICVPGSTTNCQTIDHIQVDTASVGLRILAPALTLTLPGQSAMSGNPLVECTVFADGFSWGPVALADVQIAGETANSVPIQVIGDSGFTKIPSDCSGTGAPENTVTAFGANGILGIGVFTEDCGPACASAAISAFYYSCTTTLCQSTTVPVANQVSNPVFLFAADNNGTIIDLPNVASQGALTITGSLIFGVDTRSNNASGGETVLTVAGTAGSGSIMPGNLTVLYYGQSLDTSFIDSGSNGIFFDDANIPVCTATGYTDFYCPPTNLNLIATLEGINGVSAAVNFGVDSAQMLGTNNPKFVVLPTLAGPNPLPGSFDFGLAFFYGRRVATVIEGEVTSVGTGPYVAF
jgi:hypothetical protein